MDVFLSKHRDKMKQAISSVDQYDRSLKSLSLWWGKIALIGKINSFEVAATILDDMDKTRNQFYTLQTQLIEHLVNEHTRKVVVQQSSLCRMAIDVLIRNLFERTADIGFLSTDQDVINFLKTDPESQADIEAIRLRLQAYVTIYSVYQDAFLLTPNGEVIFQLTSPSRTGRVADDFVRQALKKPNDYVEYFGHSELTPEDQQNLFYAQAVQENNVVVGVIVLCFRFQNELESIIERSLSNEQDTVFMLINGAGKVLFAPKEYTNRTLPSISVSEQPEILMHNGKNMIQVCARGQAYQGYSGPKDWYVCSLSSLSSIESSAFDGKVVNQQTTSKVLSGLISKELFAIRHHSTDINNDLELIVLNGVITAARTQSAEFVPVLDAIKNIGKDIDLVFENSINSLFATIIAGQMESVRLQASLAVDIMDRNLYERANDCRWWALNPSLQLALAGKGDRQSIENTLGKIHSLYTVYHTLYVYDNDAKYVAFSDGRESKIGQSVESKSGAQATFNFKNIYEYSVSPFVAFDCYQGRHTYIYNAAIRDVKNFNHILGGIGIVFDSDVEFKAILMDVLPRENGQPKVGCKALFTDGAGYILSSSSVDHAIGDVFTLNVDRKKLSQEGSIAMISHLGDQAYLVGAAISSGYREYKRDDGYMNPIIAWVLIPC